MRITKLYIGKGIYDKDKGKGNNKENDILKAKNVFKSLKAINYGKRQIHAKNPGTYLSKLDSCRYLPDPPPRYYPST